MGVVIMGVVYLGTLHCQLFFDVTTRGTKPYKDLREGKEREGEGIIIMIIKTSA